MKIRVDVRRQVLELLEWPSDDTAEAPRVRASYPVSTSGYGLGTEPGSLKTPTGRFRIARKIGGGTPLGAVFKGRRFTGQIGPRRDPHGEEDLIQTRILWLDGLDPDNANTRERYIYIHGTNHEESIGTPCSHGCVRMRNAEIAELFDLVIPGTEVEIGAPPAPVRS